MARFGFGLGFGSQSVQFAPAIGTARYFTTLDAAGNQYWDTDSDVVLSGDFEIEFDAVLGNAGSFDCILGEGLGSSNRFTLLSGSFRIVINGTQFAFTFSPDLDAKLRNYRLVRSGSDLSFYQDGVFKETITGNTSNFRFNTIGNSAGINFLTGLIANVKITDAGTPVHLWKLDESDPSAAVDSIGSNDLTGNNITSADAEQFTKSGLDWLGADIWTHGDVSASSAASGFVGGVSVTAVNGYTYKFFYDVANFVEGSTAAIVGAAGSSRTANGTYTDIITATGTSAGWNVATNPTTLDVNSGIIKRILEAP